jgi:hypothetical protein
MTKARNTKPAVDPIFAAIEAHKAAVIAHEVACDAHAQAEEGIPWERRKSFFLSRVCCGDEHDHFVNTDAPEWLAVAMAYVDALDAEISTAIALTNIHATTIPGLMAVTVYVSNLTNCGYDWTIGEGLIDEDAGDTEPRSFEACLIRSCAVALAQINGVTAISARS